MAARLVLKEEERQLTPSVYAKEVSQSTEERQLNNKKIHLPRILDRFDMSETTDHKLSSVGTDRPLFQPYPSELIFQNFTPTHTYQLCLRLLNNDKVSRHVALELQESEHFHVDGPKEAGSKVAPGLFATFTVSFTPQENKDYHHRLVYVTERERFEVPVHAIGPRAILNFKDEVHLPVCPVKASTERTHLVRNIGKSEAKFTLRTQSPFSVMPSSGTLCVGESTQVTVVFNPMTIENFTRVLYLEYHTGEVVHITLYGSSKELNVHLERDSILLKKTYVSQANVHTVSLTNRSDVILQYCWTTWPSLQEEALNYLRGSIALQQNEKEKKEQNQPTVEQLLFQCESHPKAIHDFPLLTRALQERRSQAVKDNILVLSHSCIIVEPAEGEIWPKMTAQFHFVFKPNEAKLYQQTLYCDVTGCESRLPLTISGEGVGPTLQPSYDLMDMKNVFIGGKDCYEVLLSNKGLIDAHFRLSSPDTTFGSCFTFSPEEGVVPVGASQIVKVTFHSPVLGTFSEDLLLSVTGQPEPLILTFRGRVIGPTFHFDVPELNFGDVAFGFPQTLTCVLFNTSFVSMTFALRVLGDGPGAPSVTCDKQVSDLSMNNWKGSAARDPHARPKEFTISPAARSMYSMSDVDIKVTLCSNTVGTYRLALVVDVEGVGKEIMSLPVTARCLPVPDIVVETPVLDFQRCFLDQSCEQNVHLINTSPLPVCYGMLDQKYAESPSVICGSSKPRGVIPPHSSEVLPVSLRAKATGRLHHTLHIAVFGSVKPPLVVGLSCIGKGPVVHLPSQQLDFGTIPVLTDIVRTLQLSNWSPIPAPFTAHMSHGKHYSVEPREGEVPPQGLLELKVVAHLKDTLLLDDKLEISIRDAGVQTVLLSATGTGTTIVSDRPFGPRLDLGTHFSHETCQYHLKLTNRGQRVHRMYWKTEDFLLSTKTGKRRNSSGKVILPPIAACRKDLLGRGSSSSREKPVLSFSPSRVELFPGHSTDMILTVSSDSPKAVLERLVCTAVVGRGGRNERIMSVDVTCCFVDPNITFSSKQLNFYINKVPGKSLVPVYEKLGVMNATCLPVCMELSVAQPFSLCEAAGVQSSATTKSMVLEDGRTAELWVAFNPAFKNKMSLVLNELLTVSCQGFPNYDNIKLHGEVHFPNLHFSTITVDFGCALNDTETHRDVTVTNCSPLPVSFSWAFLDQPPREMEIPETEDAEGPGPGANTHGSIKCAIGVQEVFDICPIHGHLQPGDQQLVTFSFYGHQNVLREVVALCHVEDGPTYEILLRGEASVISYSLDPTNVDFGVQLFDHVGEAEVTLSNTGKIGFKFSITPPQKEDDEAGGQRKALGERPDAWQHEQNEEGQVVTPGRPIVIPTTGFVGAGAKQSLWVRYLPGIPEVFRKRLQLQVAFLTPQDVTLSGVAVYPRLRLNLPQNLYERYSDVVQQARAAVEAHRVREELTNGITSGGGATTEENCSVTHEEQLHMEMERALVRENALAVTDCLLELRDASDSSGKWRKLSKFLLPEYVWDFGFVIPGRVLSHTVNVTNPGPVAVTFKANCKPLAGTGFCAEIERVINLPSGKTQAFPVRFDPQGARLGTGNISVVLPIQVKGGPTVQVRLCAVVTVPVITVSMDTLQFDTVRCGMCQLKTVQLFNSGSVSCSWTIAEEVEELPGYRRTKLLQERRLPPLVFNMIPSSGMLSAGERVNVQIKFSPVDGRAYQRQLVVRVAESPHQVFITAQGQGDAPLLNFCPPELQLGPCLPGTTEAEALVTVKNPCSFPIEFYCLELDTQHLEEEKVLRLMQGYDENNILLLPPRAPGESLPTELLDYYKEHCSHLKDNESKTGDTREDDRTPRQNTHPSNSKEGGTHTLTVKPAELLISEMTKEANRGRLGQLEMSPVSRALARYIGLTPEGLAARNRRGIAIIVYGAPLTAISSTAAALAQHYGGACLSVDAVVRDVLMNGTSPVSLTARQLCDRAAVEYAKEKPEAAAQTVKETTEPGSATHLEASDPASTSIPASFHEADLIQPSEDSCHRNDSSAPLKTECTLFSLCLGGNVTALSDLFPEALLADILTERFQRSDCHRGIVIDGLKSVYTRSAASTLHVVLQALNNRKHIYVVNLSDSYAALKAREKTKDALQREKADREMQWLQDLEDEEYEALPEGVEKRIVQQHTEMLRQQKLREAEQKRKQEEQGHKEEPRSSPEGNQPSVDVLQSQFSAYNQTQKQVEHILQHWDRAQGLLLVSLPNKEHHRNEEGPQDKQTAGKKKRKANSMSPMSRHMVAPAEADKVSIQDTVPHIVLNVTGKDYLSTTELLKGSTLPPPVQVLDDLGLGPSGPPIPSPVTLSMVPFPETRKQSNTQLTCDCFTLLDPSWTDEQGEEKKEGASAVKEEAATTPSRSVSKGFKESESTKDKDKKGRETQRSKRQTSAKTKAKGVDQSHSSSLNVSSTSDCTKQDEQQRALKLRQSLKTFRWVVPANGEVALRVWFYSDSPGKFNETLSFQLLGSQTTYRLSCRGMCTYPTVSKDHMTLFGFSKKVEQVKEGLQKAYIVKPGYFEFGPLLCGKTRERYKENRYPENTERLVIHNNSGLEAEVQFHFQHDTHATTYLLDPPTMTLKPDQKQELTVWAYPTKLGQIKDSVVCYIKDNPELVIINLSCWGVRPELELESRHMHFHRVLLHRRDSQTVMLHNKTALPVSWRLLGVKELGDEFIVPQDRGTISPYSSFPLCLHFSARRPLHIKKILRLEVSDVEKILGTIHTENIQVTAEAYDIALDISPDACLDFGTIKVFEEVKLSLRLKNQGKYEIAYKLVFQKTNTTQPNLDSMFTLSTRSGTLMPHERPVNVQIVCRPNKEVLIEEQPVLSCQVIEPNIGNGGETVAIIAIKVSVKSVFSRYNITPACEINFGPLGYGCREKQSFTIENNGVFGTRFTICRMITDPPPPGRPGGPGTEMPRESHLDRPTAASSKVRQESFHKDMNIVPSRLTTGVFSVSPCTGCLQPGSRQVVTVDCMSDQLGNWNQCLLIDISDRDPSDQPDGIRYRLLADVCKPGIALDIPSIFEEHHLCLNSSQLSSEQFCHAESIYIQNENKFIFSKLLVGRTAQARFKFTNNSKLPCVFSLAITYGGAKTSRSMEVFDLPVTTLSIPSQSHSFAVVTFTPQATQVYSAVFEATLEGTSRTTPASNSKVLEFHLMGAGYLPSVCVVRPSLSNRGGSPMLLFRRIFVGRRRTLPLVLLNDGNVPAQVMFDMLDRHGVFTIKAAPGNTCSSIDTIQLQDTTESENQRVHRAALRLNVNQQVKFEVSFCSDKPLSVKAKISLQVEDNPYNSPVIIVTSEAYKEIVSVDNISGSWQEMDEEDEEGDNYERLDFGDCCVDVSYQHSLIMTNHSSSQVVRFEWPPAGNQIFFSPQVGHLHAGCSKAVVVTFGSSQPLTLTSQPMRCNFCQVEFQQPIDEVAAWDDRQGTVQCSSRLALKNEVPKTDPEPLCSVVEGSQWESELRISAVCDYVKFSCNTDTIHFKDTMLYQSRLQQLQIVNHGTVRLEFSMQVVMDPSNNTGQGDGTLTSRPGSRSARPAKALAGTVPLPLQNPEPPSISVEPTTGAIKPGAMQDFSIRFSPLAVGQVQGRLLCSIPNLQAGDQAPSILLYGRGLLPHCHFDLEDSDYISGNRRNPEFRAPLDPNIRIIEFNAAGLSAVPKRCLRVVNPTSKAYSFKWRCTDTGGSPFRCLTPRGTIQPGNNVEVCFEYAAEQLDTVESFWCFLIETLSLSVPFLCVGTIIEPLVYLDRPHLNFGDLLVGCKVEQVVSVVNGEDERFHFSVMQSSLLCNDQQSSLMLQPMTGTVAPKDRLSLSVSFMPCREGYVSFRLIVRVKRKSEPLTLTVKANCFTLSTSVQVEKPGGGLREVKPNHQDTLDFGKVEISEKSTFNFLVSSLTRFSAQVSFDLTAPSELLQHLAAKPQNATIEAGKQLQLSLIFHPRSICNLQDVRLSIKVKHGPTFTFAIKGGAAAPSLDFSFTKYNFGKCFLYRPGMVPASQTLVISNKGTREVSVQCPFKNGSCFEMDFEPDVLSPGAVREVPVTFCPREACRYHDKLTFILNSCVTKHVHILGQGIETKLEVQDPRQRNVKLGSLTLGQTVKQQVVLVNHSPLDLCFTLLLNPNTLLDPRDLSFSPAGELNLRAGGGSCNVHIQFSPRQHIPPFTAELQAEFAGLLHPLLTIQGCCQGVEVQLDQAYLAFGAVVQHCQARKRIVMKNSGNVGTRFQWETESFPPELSITPAKGRIAPGTEVPFEVSFAPVQLSSDARYENLSCCVEGSSSPITLTVTGSCIVASASTEAVDFVCPVRGSHTLSVPMANPTTLPCSVRPVIEGEQWSAAPSVTLEPLQNKAYEITYRPTTMTADGKKHLGSVFFSFPDGTATLFSLQGSAEPPEAEDTIVHKLPAKTHHTQLLPVHNWLCKRQRFRVLIELLKPDQPDATVSLKGQGYLDVPALATTEYRMTFFAYREGQYNTKVTFRNEVSGEFLFYLVTFKATSPGSLSTMELVTAVRRAASATVQVENPLTTPTCLTSECKCLDISVPPQHTVPGQSKCSLSFQFRPLHAGESTAQLTLSSNELGFFHYDLLLRALPPPPEETVRFSTCLGSSHTVLIKFINYSRIKTKYSCKTDHPDFIVDKSVGASPGFQAGSEASVEVCFEPHGLGQVTGQLRLSSAVGGEYIFPLRGSSLPPKAQGPCSIRAGHTITLPFKNVFLQTTAFSFQVDNPCFTAKGVDTMLSKVTQDILISFQAPLGSSPGPWFGTLTVSSRPSEGRTKPHRWLYYLKGYRPDSA